MNNFTKCIYGNDNCPKCVDRLSIDDGWQIRFDKHFGSQKDHRTREIGNDLVDTIWYYYELNEEDIKSFIAQEIDIALADDRKRIIDKCAEMFHPYCGEPSCFEKLEKIIITKDK